MLDDNAFALNQTDHDEATLLFLERNRFEREFLKMRELVNEAVLIVNGLKAKEDFTIRAIKAMNDNPD